MSLNDVEIRDTGEATPAGAGVPAIPRPPEKDRSGFLAVLQRHLRAGHLSNQGSVLAVGGSAEDAAILQAAGFGDITLSNFGGGLEWQRMAAAAPLFPTLAIDAEQMDLRDGAFDVVFAHEVLHHCRSPHRALCEMLRVSRRYVVFMEPNDCWLMRLLVPLRLSFPFEISVVVDQNYEAGGVRNSQIPNFIFRWNAREVSKTVSAFLAEEVMDIHAYPYWELNPRERDLELRKQTRLALIARCVGGTRNLVRMLPAMAAILNVLPPVRRQGNKFFCCLERRHQLREWLRRDGGKVVFDRDFQRVW